MLNVFAQYADNKEDICCCAHCGNIIGNIEELADAFISGNAVKHVKFHCELGCGLAYCSIECRNIDKTFGHGMICLGRATSENHPLYQLRILSYSVGYYDSFNVALKVVALMLSNKDCITQILKSLNMAPSWESIMNRGRNHVNDSWSLINASLPVTGSVISKEIWSRLLAITFQKSLSVVCINPLTKYLGKCRRNTENMDMLRAICDAINSRDSDDDFAGDNNDEDMNSASSQSGEAGSTRAVITVSQLLEAPEAYFENLTGLTLSFDEQVLSAEQCCIPSYMPVFKNGITFTFEKTSYSKCDMPTICWVLPSLNFEERSDWFMEHGTRCHCRRCEFESQKSGNMYPSAPLAFYQEMCALFEYFEMSIEVQDLVNSACHHLPAEPWPTYKKAIVLGWNGAWGRAHQVRSKFMQKYGIQRDEIFYPMISYQAEITNFFQYSSQDNAQTIPVDPNAFQTIQLGDHSGAYSRNGIISAQDCNQLLKQCEVFARQHGRWLGGHVEDVDTSKVALFSIPQLRDAIRNLILNQIFPIVAAHHGVSAHSLRVIELLVTKYDTATIDTFVPLKTDESQYSFLMALDGDFAGSSIFFAQSNTNVNLLPGAILSYPGHLPYAPSFVRTGNHYIFSGLLYAD